MKFSNSLKIYMHVPVIIRFIITWCLPPLYKLYNRLFCVANDARQAIPPALQEIEDSTCLQFREVTNQQYYLNFIAGSGCWSYIGNIKRAGGQEVMFKRNIFSPWAKMECWKITLECAMDRYCRIY